MILAARPWQSRTNDMREVHQEPAHDCAAADVPDWEDRDWEDLNNRQSSGGAGGS